MSKSQESIWQKRWLALEGTMAHMTERAQSRPTLQALVACLNAFGKSQLLFFQEGFNEGRLLRSLEYPAEYVLRATLDQVSYDLSVIERALEQRTNGLEKMRSILDTADVLAQDALNLAVGSGLMQPATAVTYFNKSANIRVIPYAPVALVGIPYTCLQTERDFLTIPHEVGHYVYRHGEGLAAQLETMISLMPSWQHGWMEEIFADVYGCLVAGPLMGLSFQDLVLDNSLEEFIGDDGEHPVDAIRPYLYSHVLRALQFPQAAKALDERWQTWLPQRGTPTVFVPQDTMDEIELTVARKVMETMADTVLALLTEAQTMRQNNPGGYWSQEVAASADVEALYDSFAAWVQAGPAVDVYQLQDLGERVGLVLGEAVPVNVRRKGATQTWRDWMKERSLNSRDKLPPEVWMPIFVAGGWPVKGPEGSGGSGLP